MRPVDDSVGRETDDQFQLLRRARGYAPIPIRLERSLPRILAVGGHLKNVVGLSVESDVVLSPHIGDLDNSLSREVHRRAIVDLVEFFGVIPDAIACDLHPGLCIDSPGPSFSRRVGHSVDSRSASPRTLFVRNGREPDLRTVLGFSWDGTGYGLDGTVWGGETFLGEESELSRIAHLRTFPLPGGDRVAREPCRAALGVLHELFGTVCAPMVADWFTGGELATLFGALSPRQFFLEPAAWAVFLTWWLLWSDCRHG